MRPRICVHCGSGGPWYYHEGTRGQEPGIGRFYCQACGLFLGRATAKIDLSDPSQKEIRWQKKVRWRNKRRKEGKPYR